MSQPPDHKPPVYTTGEFEIQQINNRVLGFPRETAPIITPECEPQVLAFGTLEALFTNIREYNEAFAAIQSTKLADDSDTVNSVLEIISKAGKDIKTIGSYLKCVGLVGENWDSSPGLKLLLNPETIKPVPLALKERERKLNEQDGKPSESTREFIEELRKKKLEEAILDGIKGMLPYWQTSKDRENTASRLPTGPDSSPTTPVLAPGGCPLKFPHSGIILRDGDIIFPESSKAGQSTNKSSSKRTYGRSKAKAGDSSSVSLVPIPEDESIVEVAADLPPKFPPKRTGKRASTPSNDSDYVPRQQVKRKKSAAVE
ncbi:hypothetical protein BGW36DRAFT_356312 [Talaromyces proteolyticus]|uniref:Uncharacterized protein n=1 Tax=Talaromyces proteolyticus TaxID=1131652 RepID=A0AAD4L118_9EURO|nr:uncharacterized protein BGW36DRAFT_356312 [Talaromyces proteolyticus]KAH8702176.1 hypothetical protein BGW36DRAFT_356312 [Talaromyces proteolyticus]